MRKRVLSLLMTAALCISLFPPAVLADDESVADVLQNEEVQAEEIAGPTDGDVQDGGSDTAVSEVQTLIGNLPDELTADNADAAAEQENTAAVPVANAEDKPQGEGTPTAPYLIGTLNELEWFRDTVNGGKNGICAELTADIALGSEWTPIGTAATPYIGTFNGGGYRITAREMTADTQGWGLFGAIGERGTVQALTVSIDRLTVTANAAESGVMAAKNAGTIERCTVRINNKLYFKACIGLIAYQNSGTIENCWGGTVANTPYDDNINAAGMAYVNSGMIKSCYYNGAGRWRDRAVDCAITSSLVDGTVENCYCFDTNLWRGDDYYLYMDGKRNGITSVEKRERLASGEITWKLNGSDNTKTEPWRQDTQAANGRPTLDASAGRVTKNDDDTYTLETLHAHRVNGVLEDFTALADNLSGSGN